VTAVDVADEMLRIAESKKYRCPVDFCRCDAFCLPFADDVFDGGIASFWLSHVPKARLGDFLSEFHRVLEKGARIFMMDNVYAQGVGGELITRMGDENTYKIRKLMDGSEHLVLKNYFSVDELVELLGDYASELRMVDVSSGKCYWHVVYERK
jgi:ubiquinone/menaquinone biosynthesis C-methylase UbiE